MLGFSRNESSIDISDDDAESSDEDDRSSTNDNKNSERIVRAGPMIMMPLNNVRRRNQEVPLIVTLITYISYLDLITGKHKLDAVTSSQLPQVDNRPFPHKMTFRVVASLVQSRWLKHGYVCLSPSFPHKEMDLTIFIDIYPNPGPLNCLSCLYLNARSLKAFNLFHLVLTHRSRSVRSPSFRTWYTLVSMIWFVFAKHGLMTRC